MSKMLTYWISKRQFQIRLYVFLSCFILLISQSLFAGDKVGNGGGLWTCSFRQNLTQGMLVDLYEAEEEFSLELISSIETDPFKIVNERNNYIKINLPIFYNPWNQKLTESLNKIHFVNSELTIVEDALYRIKPLSSRCSEGWSYTQFANYTNQDQILIRDDLWKNPIINPIHKAALVWHEVIYAWLRDQYHEKDSVRARQIVGLLFSKLPQNIMQEKMNVILNSIPNQPDQPYWFCVIRNMYSFKYFANYGLNQMEASTKATQACNEGQFSSHCDEYNIKCEQILNQNSKVTCQIKNYVINKSYFANGLIHLEAEFKVRDLCSHESDPVHCDHPVQCQ